MEGISEMPALADRLKSLAAWRLVRGDVMATTDTAVLKDAIARLAFMEDESDRLHDDVARLLRERNTLAEECAMLANWQRCAAERMASVLRDHEDLTPISEASARDLAELISEAWADGEDESGSDDGLHEDALLRRVGDAP